MVSLAIHEAEPGHHLQVSGKTETNKQTNEQTN